MDSGYIFMFLGISILSSMNCRNSAIGMIERIGTNSSQYPKEYIVPAKWIRTVFKLTHRLIPRYLYFELILSLFFAALGPVNLMICIIVDCSANVVGILVMIHICLVVVNMIFFSIISSLMKRK